jgi:hypothetical protein
MRRVSTIPRSLKKALPSPNLQFWSSVLGGLGDEGEEGESFSITRSRRWQRQLAESVSATAVPKRQRLLAFAIFSQEVRLAAFKLECCSSFFFFLWMIFSSLSAPSSACATASGHVHDGVRGQGQSCSEAALLR